MHAEHDTAADNRGGFILTVAIADVAHYVTPGSALDREALVRGNSVYFPDRVVPMLPERISNDLCSLRPREDRAAIAVRMVIGADGRKRSHTFHRIMMRSAAKLSYQQAQFAIGGRTDEDTEALVQPVLAPLYAAYETLDARARRTRAARSRSAGAQNPAQGRRHRRPRDHAGAAGSAPADRGIHDPRQRRRRRDAGKGPRAADLSRARRAGHGKGQRAARVPRHPRHSVRQRRRAAGGQLQPRARAGEGPRCRAAHQRRGPAHAGAGRIRGGKLRPFRLEPAPLRAFHLADPPLCRSDRASRPDPRAQAWAGRPARGDRIPRRWPRSPRRFPRPSGAPCWPSARPTTG